MDPLSDYTALSPRENEFLFSDRRSESEDVSTQQCSADANAFAGLRRPYGVVVPPRSSTQNSGSRGGLRLALTSSSSGSQLSQFGANSQSASQFREAFLEDTQHDEDVGAVSTAITKQGENEKAREEEEEAVANVQRGHRLRGASTNSGGGFLSVLEQQHWANPSTRRDRKTPTKKTSIDSDEATVVVNGRDASAPNDEHEEDDMMPPHEELAEKEPVVRGGGLVVEATDAVDADATPVLVRDDCFEDDNADGEDAAPDVDDQDSMGSTQVLDDDLAGEQDLGDADGDADCALETSTEVFPETIDQDAISEQDHGEVSVLATPEHQPTSVSGSGGSTPNANNRSLKRKPKARTALRQDERAFIDTEDQTLAEVAARIRRERQQTETASAAVVLPLPVPTSQDDSQEELPPTQPSKPAPGALKKRGKSEASTMQLTDSQERSYEFVDSSCQCGEAVCECAGTSTTPVKPATRASSAMRNLEFAFAIPESQDSESQQFDSFPDLGALASRTLQASRLVEKPPSTKLVDHTGDTIDQLPPKRKNDAFVMSAKEATPQKARQVVPGSPSSAPTTPVATRKRGRSFLSPDAGTDSANDKRRKEVVPKKSTRSAKLPIVPPSVASGSVTPSVRTRARILSPIPNESSRAYASRTKSLFKGRFEFCLTGFTGDGQTNLTKLIEDYGGRVWERHQDVLQKKPHNKAVVIATSVSWRKLKFMFAVACGIPVVHPEWIHACIKQRQLVPFEGYCVPSGCSVTTGKFECLPVKELDIFRGRKFGIPLDVQPTNLDTTKSMSELTAFILRACGAEVVQEDLQASREQAVDIVLADEFTKVCEYHARKHQAAVKTFAWVTECMILQRFLDPNDPGFTPQQPKSTDSKTAREEVAVMAASAKIGDSDQTTLKLHTGELLLVDLSAEGKIDHFLLFDVCEILSIHVTQSESSKRKASVGPSRSVRLRVGVLERRPNSPELSRRHTRVIDLSADKVKRRVVAVSKADFDAMLYRDESIFYYAEE